MGLACTCTESVQRMVVWKFLWHLLRNTNSHWQRKGHRETGEGGRVGEMACGRAHVTVTKESSNWKRKGFSVFRFVLPKKGLEILRIVGQIVK